MDKKIINSQEIRGDSNVQQTINNAGVVINGMLPEEAVSIVSKLFYDNFPKLVEEAKQLVEERIKEVESSLLKAFKDNNVTDFSAFGRPDVQYSVLELEKTYAKYGNQEMLDLLTKLVLKRISVCSSDKMGFALDMAMDLANKLNSMDLDLLSLTFATKMVEFGRVVKGDINSVIIFFNDIASKLNEISMQSFNFLQSLNCFCLNIGDAYDRISETYKVDKKTLEEKLCEKYKNVPYDYALTYPATVLAIINLEAKTNIKFNLQTWIS